MEKMEKIGRIKYTSYGEYSPDATYTPMNTVLFEGSRWECIKETTGNAPPDHVKNEDGSIAENEFWRLFLPGALGDDYIKKTDIAKAPTETEAGKPGIVMPDGKTIQIDENGLLTGTPIDFMGTPKELQQAIQAGEVTEGMNLFIEDAEDSEEPDPDHPNNMLFPLDDFLSTVSSNAVMNWVLTNALNRLEQLENETRALRSTLTEFGLSKICPVDVTDVTEDNGIVLGAKEKNASISGTIMNSLELIRSTMLDRTDSESITLSLESSFSVVYGRFSFIKKNGRICLNTNLIFNSTMSAGESHVIGTIETKYAPKANLIFVCAADNGTLYSGIVEILIKNTGIISVYAISGSNIKRLYIFGMWDV